MSREPYKSLDPFAMQQPPATFCVTNFAETRELFADVRAVATAAAYEDCLSSCVERRHQGRHPQFINQALTCTFVSVFSKLESFSLLIFQRNRNATALTAWLF